MMVKKLFSIFFVFFLIVAQGCAQDMETLKQKIQEIVHSKNSVVGVAIQGMKAEDTLSIYGRKHFPMQSVFKFPIALVVLSEVDKGHLSLDQKIEIKKEELLPGFWSPIRKKYPEGVIMTIAEIIEYTVALSDNAGCDALLRLLGGPLVVENYFSNLGFKDFAVKINEETMQSNWDSQFLNWTTPIEANNILTTFYNNENALLTKESHEFIWTIMNGTKTGKKKIRGQLPKETMVAHKTGWSGRHKATGITAAVNDIGMVTLPNGDHFAISVFITQSTEDFETNEKIIADISKVAWDYFMGQ